MEVMLAGAGPRGDAGEEDDGDDREARDEPPPGLWRSPAEARRELGDEARPDPRQHRDRLADDVLGEPVDAKTGVILGAPSALKQERHPLVLRIPDEHR